MTDTAEREALVKRLRPFLRELVDHVWSTAFEDQSVPATEWADRMIDETIAVASTDAATALESLGARPQTATEALRNLVAKIDELTPAINGMTQIAYLHGVPWEAGNWFTELNAAKSALAAAPPPTSQWFSKEELAKIQGLMDHVIPCARRRSLSAKCTCGLLEIDAKIDAILSPPPTEQDKP